MQQLTVKQVIASTLLRICREATDKVRPKEEPKPRKYSQEQVAEIHAMLKQLGWSGEKMVLQAKLQATLFDAPELNAPSIIPLELFCVVVLESSDGGHGYSTDLPIIVTDYNNRYCLHTDGVLNHWSFFANDKPRLATDEEIQLCIESLTDQQWRTIHSNEIFKPVMDEAMKQAVSVDMEPVTGNGSMDSEEHILPDGRKITVDAE